LVAGTLPSRNSSATAKSISAHSAIIGWYFETFDHRRIQVDHDDPLIRTGPSNLLTSPGVDLRQSL